MTGSVAPSLRIIRVVPVGDLPDRFSLGQKGYVSTSLRGLSSPLGYCVVNTIFLMDPLSMGVASRALQTI